MTLKVKPIITIAFLLVAASLAFHPRSALAQDKTPLPLKIVIVNIDTVRTQSTAYKQAGKQFMTYKTNMNVLLAKEQKALRTANAEMSRQRTLLSPEAFTVKRKKYEQRVTAFQNKFQTDKKALTKIEAGAIGKMNRKIIKIIAKYAQDHNVTLVLPETVTILTSKSLNINDYILKALNKELPTVQVNLPVK